MGPSAFLLVKTLTKITEFISLSCTLLGQEQSMATGTQDPSTLLLSYPREHYLGSEYHATTVSAFQPTGRVREAERAS